MTAPSPYQGLDESACTDKTRELIDAHPVDPKEFVEVVLLSWDAIFSSRIGAKGFRVGEHLFPKPQIMGFFLHELIALELESRYPRDWHGDKTAEDKDLVYVSDVTFSVEIKTSSSKNRIFGNRSYAQRSEASADNPAKKGKSGYYLAVNFEKFSSTVGNPRDRLVRFGWLDANDWIGQKAATGQQARLQPSIERSKLLTLYSAE
ncbi:MAG: ScaI family restriction endonuclease [Actinomycetota bacterium]|nr:ScaI family restriction endonuclease [Actinomycetota bacterium]